MYIYFLSESKKKKLSPFAHPPTRCKLLFLEWIARARDFCESLFSAYPNNVCDIHSWGAKGSSTAVYQLVNEIFFLTFKKHKIYVKYHQITKKEVTLKPHII